MFCDEFLSMIDSCCMYICGRMGKEACAEFFGRNYTDPIPAKWKETLLNETILLSPDSQLYRTFWYCGMRDEDEMVAMVLNVLYLSYHTQRLPGTRSKDI